MELETEETASSSDKERQQPVSLVIPCKAEYLSLCRLVAAAVGATRGLNEDAIADLKLVVTEACSCFLWGPDGQPAAGGAGVGTESCYLRVDYEVDKDSWRITISDPERRRRVSAGQCDPSTEQGLRLTILRALVGTLEHTDTENEGSIIRLTKKIP